MEVEFVMVGEDCEKDNCTLLTPLGFYNLTTIERVLI